MPEGLGFIFACVLTATVFLPSQFVLVKAYMVLVFLFEFGGLSWVRMSLRFLRSWLRAMFRLLGIRVS